MPESPTPRERKKRKNSTTENSGVFFDDMSILTTTDVQSLDYGSDINDIMKNNDEIERQYYPKSPSNNFDDNSSLHESEESDNHNDAEDHELDHYTDPHAKKTLKSKKKEDFHDLEVDELKVINNVVDDVEEGTTESEVLEYMDEEKRMKIQLGGEENLEKMGSDWVNFAQWVRKKTKKKGNMFNFSGDLADACDRGDHIRAYAIMVMGADPNILHNDKPLFFHLFEKLVNMDETLNTLNVGDKLTVDQQKVIKAFFVVNYN